MVMEVKNNVGGGSGGIGSGSNLGIGGGYMMSNMIGGGNGNNEDRWNYWE